MLALTACVGAPESGDDESSVDMDIPPSGRGAGTLEGFAVSNPASLTQAGIQYHGGPVMTNSVHIYYIWYGGQWSGNSATTILPDFASSVGGSPWWHINTTYVNGSSTPVSNTVTLAGQYTYPGPYNTSLSDSAIKTIVTNSIGAAPKLPSDSDGIYFVLTSQEVTASSGFCTQYCGWHTYASIGGKNIKYSFVGNAARCLSACSAQTTSPNGNPGADAMASIIGHEAAEAASDPQLNAWYDASGYENADKCAWTWGTTSTAANGSKYNMTLGSRQFLIQRNWLNSGSGSCAKSF